jgi:hypothetical protein
MKLLGDASVLEVHTCSGRAARRWSAPAPPRWTGRSWDFSGCVAPSILPESCARESVDIASRGLAGVGYSSPHQIPSYPTPWAQRGYRLAPRHTIVASYRLRPSWRPGQKADVPVVSSAKMNRKDAHSAAKDPTRLLSVDAFGGWPDAYRGLPGTGRPRSSETRKTRTCDCRSSAPTRR